MKHWLQMMHFSHIWMNNMTNPSYRQKKWLESQNVWKVGKKVNLHSHIETLAWISNLKLHWWMTDGNEMIPEIFIKYDTRFIEITIYLRFTWDTTFIEKHQPIKLYNLNKNSFDHLMHWIKMVFSPSHGQRNKIGCGEC